MATLDHLFLIFRKIELLLYQLITLNYLVITPDWQKNNQSANQYYVDEIIEDRKSVV